MKVIEKADVKDEMQHQIDVGNKRLAKKGFKPITLDVLHTNQPHGLAEHLRYDTPHRMLPHLRIRARNTHPEMMGLVEPA